MSSLPLISSDASFARPSSISTSSSAAANQPQQDSSGDNFTDVFPALGSEGMSLRQGTIKQDGCSFCFVTEDKFTIVKGADDWDYKGFVDHRPSGLFHWQIVPEEHIVSVLQLRGMRHFHLVFKLRQACIELYEHSIPRSLRSHHPLFMGFHVPPFTSIKHLHLHCIVGPIVAKKAHYNGRFPFLWAPVDEVLDRLSLGKTGWRPIGWGDGWMSGVFEWMILDEERRNGVAS